jgi:hypothetical protein
VTVHYDVTYPGDGVDLVTLFTGRIVRAEDDS